MTSDWVTTGLSAVVILAAAAVHGIAGFGFAQVSMGIMPLVSGRPRARRSSSRQRRWWPTPASGGASGTRSTGEKWIVPVGGLVVGMPLGIVVFSGFDAAQMRVAIGAVLVLAVIVVGATQQLDVVTDWIEEKDYRPGKIIGATAGLLAGILGGAVAVPGPPMIVYGAFMSASGFWTDKEMKATFTAFFGTLMLYRLGSLTYTGSRDDAADDRGCRRRADGVPRCLDRCIHLRPHPRAHLPVGRAGATDRERVRPPVHGDSGTLTAFSRLRTAVSVPLDTAVVAKNSVATVLIRALFGRRSGAHHVATALGAFREDLGTDLAVLGIVTLTFFGTLLAGAGAGFGQLFAVVGVASHESGMQRRDVRDVATEPSTLFHLLVAETLVGAPPQTPAASLQISMHSRSSSPPDDRS